METPVSLPTNHTGYGGSHTQYSSPTSAHRFRANPLRNKQGAISFPVRVNYGDSAVHGAPQYKCRFTIRAVYSIGTKMSHISDQITKHLSKRFPPVSFKIRHCHYDSFTGTNGIKRKQSIMTYDRDIIISKGLRVDVEVLRPLSLFQFGGMKLSMMQHLDFTTDSLRAQTDMLSDHLSFNETAIKLRSDGLCCLQRDKG